MKLLTKEICNKIPELYSGDGKNAEQIEVIVKFFCPWSSWTWYATEASGVKNQKYVSLKENNWEDCEDVIFFGFVEGMYPELGYFSLKELMSVEGPMGLSIERDLYFSNKTLSEVQEKVYAKH